MFSITYEESFWDTNQALWLQMAPTFGGIEWCLTREALGQHHYQELIRTAIAHNQMLAFHIPHHVASQALAVDSGDIDKHKRYENYRGYLELIMTIASEAKAIKIIVHPYASSHANIEASIDNTIERHRVLQNYLSAYPNSQLLLEIVPAVGWQMGAYQQFVNNSDIATGALCLDTAHLIALDGLDQWHWLKEHTAYCHVHSSLRPHSGIRVLSEQESVLIRSLDQMGIMLNIELLAPYCDDYLLELQETQQALLRALGKV